MGAQTLSHMEQAHESSAVEAPAESEPVRARRRREEQDPEQSKKNVVLLVGLVALGAAVASLFLFGMKDNAIYSKPVDQLLAEKAKFTNKPVRAEGFLVHGTLEKRESPCEYRFTIQKNGVEVPVRFAQCVVPDTFRDVPNMDVGVTVEGQLRADNSFDATNVLAKCPSKYEMKERAGRGETMPHGDLGGT